MTAQGRRLTGVVALGALAAAGVASAVPAHADPAPLQHVIVRSTGADPGMLDRLVTAAGGHVDRRLGLISAVSATVPASAVPALRAASGVREVTADAAVTLASTTSDGYEAQADANSMFSIEQAIGARQLWRNGFTGKGVDVALIDSGVAPVPGINGRNVVQGPDLTWESLNSKLAGMDTYGHGTHMAGIIAGHDAAVTDVTAAGDDTQDFLGVAPDARIVSVKVADRHGTSDVSQVIAGIDWVVQHAQDNGLNIRVLNLSFGTNSTQPYTLDPLAYAAEQAWKHGIVTVVSAGNTGASNGQMTDPAIDPYVLAVGAAETNDSASVSDDTIPSFSAVGDGSRNPDLVAPGVHVQSLQVPGSYIDATYGSTAAFGGRFFRGSGTSQAAAVVTGSVALLLQRAPGLTPDQVKYLLTSAATSLPAADAQAQGAGLISLAGIDSGDLPRVSQDFLSSTGSGTIEAARGTRHVVLQTPFKEITLSGERDVFGRSITTSLLARAEASGNAWLGGTFNSSAWADNGWTSSAWASSAWASSAWATSAWASSAWATSAWASSAWSSSAWSSSAWSSSAWADASWQSSAWS